MEIISFGLPSAKPPLLFVHGSYCGAWIWERFFLPYFAEKGWWGNAISLRGHGKSSGAEWIDLYGLADYLTDVSKGANALKEISPHQPPVIIGHSLGGLLAQMYALRKPLSGMALLSTPSLYGLAGSAQHIAMHNPVLAWHLAQLMTIGPLFVDQSIIADALFSSAMSKEDKLINLPLLQRESRRAACEAYWPQSTFKPRNPPPTFVLGGEKDAFIPTIDLERSANMWNGTLKILPDLPHAFMIDPTWEKAAETLNAWLCEKWP